MKTKTVNRTIRPSTRELDSSYRVKIGKRNYYDQLIVNIDHESTDFKVTYIFQGSDIAKYESIHFKVHEYNDEIRIEWVQDLNYKVL